MSDMRALTSFSSFLRDDGQTLHLNDKIVETRHFYPSATCCASWRTGQSCEAIGPRESSAHEWDGGWDCVTWGSVPSMGKQWVSRCWWRHQHWIAAGGVDVRWLQGTQCDNCDGWERLHRAVQRKEPKRWLPALWRDVCAEGLSASIWGQNEKRQITFCFYCVVCNGDVNLFRYVFYHASPSFTGWA